MTNIVLFIERQIKALKMFSLKNWCTKNPFGYRVAHHVNLLTSCPGQRLVPSLHVEDVFKMTSLLDEDVFKITSLLDEDVFKMTSLNEEDVFQLTNELKEAELKFKNKFNLSSSSLISNENVLFCDFKQGIIGNCGFVAALASMSQRPEFLTEIAPSIHRTSKGVEFHFNMFYKGDPVKVVIDDALPFDKNDNLVYARSSRKDNAYIAALFEKAFVKLICNKSYDGCDGVSPAAAFSSFSDSMISYASWEKEESKQDFMEWLMYEVDNKSSMTMCVDATFYDDPEEEFEAGHSYSVMGYNEEHKAVKLYDPNVIAKNCISNKNLPSSLIATADPNKGELWITLDQIKNRSVELTALQAKNMYKSSYQSKIELKRSGEEMFSSSCVYRVEIEEPSTIMINLFSFINTLMDFNVEVTTADDEKVKVKHELPDTINGFSTTEQDTKIEGETKGECSKKFKLQPNTYNLTFELGIFGAKTEFLKQYKTFWENNSYLMKISSSSKCKFEQLKYEKEVDFF